MDDVAQRTQRVIESLQENEALTDNLDDEAAQALLDWGSAYAQAIAASTAGLDEAAAEEAMAERLQALRRLLRTVNAHADPAQAPQAGDRAATMAYHRAWLDQVMAQIAIIQGQTFVPPADQQLAELAARWAEAPSPLRIITELRTMVESPAAGQNQAAQDAVSTEQPTRTTTETEPPPPSAEQQRAWTSLWQTVSKFFRASTPNQ
jgi:hypothetical protein